MDVKLEQVEVHSRDILVRYANVRAGDVLHYQIKPQGHSICYGIWRRAKSATTAAAATRDDGLRDASPHPPTTATSAASPAKDDGRLAPGSVGRRGGGQFYMQVQRNRSNMSIASIGQRANLEERMRQAELEPVLGNIRVAGGKVSKGEVAIEQDGIYALVLDNTFSRDKKKLVTFILHPQPATPRVLSPGVNGRTSSTLKMSSRSATNLEEDDNKPRRVQSETTKPPQRAEQHLSGTLLKRRRKKLQGWARRWFVLDLGARTLAYYISSNSTILRGSIPLNLAAVSADRRRFEINIDSGAEVWNLRASNLGAFVMWCDAFAEISQSTGEGHLVPPSPSSVRRGSATPNPLAVLEDALWDRVDAVQLQLSKICAELEDAMSPAGSDGESIDAPSIDEAKAGSKSGKRSLFRRKQADASASGKLAPPSRVLSPVPGPTVDPMSLKAVRDDLRAICLERRLARTGTAKTPAAAVAAQAETGRRSFDSVRSDNDVFEDAQEMFETFDDGLLVAHHNEDSSDEDAELVSYSSSSDSETEVYDSAVNLPVATDTQLIPSGQLYPLTDLKGKLIARRKTFPPVLDAPPSMLSVLRKTVGANSANRAAPVGLNEPLSATQRACEDLEYARLLDLAAAAADGERRLLYVAAFAVSALSSARHRERALRKPFNPLLGETFECVREDLGFRYISEKVEHRPDVVIAAHADAANWTFDQFGATQQRFYGKSLELIATGTTTIKLATGDVYVWEKPICYLRGIAYGDKYVEPTGEMTVRNHATGASAVIEFAVPTMWSGRSEDVTVHVYGRNARPPAGAAAGTPAMVGKWTAGLTLANTGEEIWKAGAMVDDAGKHCGFTAFAAQLNEPSTAVEAGRLPPSDSRLRPDLRARERGDNELAEKCKAELEETQRKRRAPGDVADDWFKPQWFDRTPDGKGYAVKAGEQSYWAARQKGDWSRALPLFDTKA